MSRVLSSVVASMLLCPIAATAAAPDVSRYWLGVECLPVPSALRSQLDLPDMEGLLVEAVASDSPAAKAGIRPYDVLARAGDKALSQPKDLIQAIESAKGNKLAIELFRNGKRQTVEATPVERPKNARRVTEQPLPGDWETMQKWIERMYPGIEEGHPALRFRVLHPGAIVPREAFTSPPLPENMSIVISKEGKQPAKIVVKRGEEKWEVTEKELDKLPADVRPHVERMMGHNLFGMLLSDANSPSRDESGRADVVVPRIPAPPEQVQKQFDELNRRMDRLMKEVETLHKEQPEQKPAEK